MFNTFSLDYKANNFRKAKIGEKILLEIRDSLKSKTTRITVCEYDKSNDLFRDVFTNQFVYLIRDTKEYILIN